LTLDTQRTEREAVEREYSEGREPFSYSARAVEVLRHDWIAAKVGEHRPRNILDVGCSLGQLTARLTRIVPEVHAIDLSLHAVARARGRNAAARFASGTVTALPYASGSFDFVVASDGPFSWNLDAADRQSALAELRRVVAPEGHVLITEHTRRRRFAELVDLVGRASLRVVNVEYLYDRPWYQFESWLKAIQHWRVAQSLRGSAPVARSLLRFGRLVGPSASRHVCILAARQS